MPEKLYAIDSICLGLQGEGYNTGKACVIVRFHGCEMSCDFCDECTEVNYNLTAKEIAGHVLAEDRSKCKTVLITGGEPLEQLEVDVCKELRAAGYYHIWLETNGAHAIPAGCSFAYVTVSPKHAPLAVNGGDELRCSIRSGEMPMRYGRLDFKRRYVSPIGDDAVQWCVQWVLKNPDWTLSLQSHKQWEVMR